MMQSYLLHQHTVHVFNFMPCCGLSYKPTWRSFILRLTCVCREVCVLSIHPTMFQPLVRNAAWWELWKHWVHIYATPNMPFCNLSSQQMFILRKFLDHSNDKIWLKAIIFWFSCCACHCLVQHGDFKSNCCDLTGSYLTVFSLSRPYSFAVGRSHTYVLR